LKYARKGLDKIANIKGREQTGKSFENLDGGRRRRSRVGEEEVASEKQLLQSVIFGDLRGKINLCGTGGQQI